LSNEAKMERTRGTVIAGVYFFSPHVFLCQEPGGQQRECLMVVPTPPIANLVLGKPRLAFRALETLLDAMLGLYDAGQLSQRRFGCGVREVVVVLHRSIALLFAHHHQQLFGTIAAPIAFCPDARLDGLRYQRAFRAVAHVDRRPGVLRQRRAPPIHADIGNLGATPATTVLRRRCVQIADQRVRRHGEQIPFSQRPQIPAKSRATPHFVISGNPAVGQDFPVLGKHLQGQRVPRAKADRGGNATLLPPLLVLRPLLVQVQPRVYQRVLLPRNIPQVQAHLAVVDFSQTPAPLPRHADRSLPLLLEPRRVKDEHAVGLGQLRADLPRQFSDQRAIVPR